MKKALLYLLLFSYTTIICKPVLPSLSDMIAHIFWYSEHMATVHYEHGRYHVHTENFNEAQKGYPAKDANLPKCEVSVSEHTAMLTSYDFTLLPVFQIHSSIVVANLPGACPNSDFPPPKAS